MARTGRLLILCLCALSLDALEATGSANSPVCRDEDGSELDWFVAIKFPKERSSSYQDDQYILFTSKQKTWRLSNYNVNDNKGAIFYTASQAYKADNSNTTVSIVYNDEGPSRYRKYPSVEKVSYGSAHMKGVLSFEAGVSGFWLIHSVPRFPGRSSYVYPETGLRFGQHFFCITFGFDQLKSIAQQLLLSGPHVYFYNLPHWMGEKIPDLRNVVNNIRTPLPMTSRMVKLQSSKGLILLHFSKSSAFGKDLYDSFVAPTLQANIYMEGWVDGAGDMPSSCDTKYRVYNVEEVSLLSTQWSTTHDHSKWVVSVDKSKTWVCLGDINRQMSQMKRGGGTMCISDLNLWAAFTRMVANFEHCSSDPSVHVVGGSVDFDIL